MAPKKKAILMNGNRLVMRARSFFLEILKRMELIRLTKMTIGKVKLAVKAIHKRVLSVLPGASNIMGLIMADIALGMRRSAKMILKTMARMVFVMR